MKFEGYKHARGFDEEKVTANIMDVYLKVLKNG